MNLKDLKDPVLLFFYCNKYNFKVVFELLCPFNLKKYLLIHDLLTIQNLWVEDYKIFREHFVKCKDNLFDKRNKKIIILHYIFCNFAN